MTTLTMALSILIGLALISTLIFTVICFLIFRYALSKISYEPSFFEETMNFFEIIWAHLRLFLPKGRRHNDLLRTKYEHARLEFLLYLRNANRDVHLEQAYLLQFVTAIDQLVYYRRDCGPLNIELYEYMRLLHDGPMKVVIR